MEGSADTTAIIIMNFALAMLLHQATQEEGQACIDAAVGSGRLHTFEDMPNMQHVNQFIKKVMRPRPIITLAIPHLNTAEDSYNG